MAFKANNTPANKKVVPRGGYILIRKLASEGAKLTGIAYALAMSPAAFGRIRERDEKALAAYERGHAEFHQRLLADLQNTDPRIEGMSVQEGIAAMRSRQIAAIFLLKTRHGYREQGSDSDGRTQLNVQINLPGSLPMDRFIKTVAVERNKVRQAITIEHDDGTE